MKIISVKPVRPAISLTWMLGSRCNYDCMYCPAELHDKTSAHPKLDKLVQTWENFYSKTKHHGLPYKLSFSGGEVTANRSFLPLIEFLRSQPVDFEQIVVTTNGSASLSYYQRLCQNIDAISFSTHSEFFNEANFFNKVLKLDSIMIRPKKSLHVNIMDEPWNQSRIELYQQLLTKHNVSHSINTIEMDHKIRDLPMMQGVYNIEQI
jgi:MoaA/NifB/PqqE/SkfB family radical SAM enzyme